MKDRRRNSPTKSRLPTKYPARVFEICGFDDGAPLAPNVTGVEDGRGGGGGGGGPWIHYAQRHRDLRTAGRSLVYVAAEGLGARLRGVTIALLLAMQSNRSLHIEWDGLSALMQPGFIDWTATNASRAAAAERVGFMNDDRLDRIVRESKGEDPTTSPSVLALPHARLADFTHGLLSDDFPMAQAQLRVGSLDGQSLTGCAVRFLFRPTPQLVRVLGAIASPAGEPTASAPAPALRGAMDLAIQTPGLTAPVVAVQMRFGDVIAFGEAGTTLYGNGDDDRLPRESGSVTAMLQCPSRRHLLGAGGPRPMVRFASDWQEAIVWAARVGEPGVVIPAAAPEHFAWLPWESGEDRSMSLEAAARTWGEFLAIAGADAVLASGSRTTTEGLFDQALLNSEDGGDGLCRASLFALGAAAVGMVPRNRIFYGREDCGVECHGVKAHAKEELGW